MITKPKPHRALLCLSVFSCLLISFSSCKRDDDTSKPTITLKTSTATYNWGDLTLAKPVQSDAVTYNSEGNVDRVVTTDGNGNTLSDISLIYSGNKITLNTQYN